MIRVHESASTEETSVAFNLNDWEQFDRYARTLEAERGAYCTQLFSKRQPNRVDYRAIHSPTRGTINLSAELESKHGPCKVCSNRFDATAGNATPRGHELVDIMFTR